MLKSLVKIANKLDSLGLTKEADVLDREIVRLAQMDEMLDLKKEDDSSDASSRVGRAIEASKNIDHFKNTFRMRNPSSESKGSTFRDEQSPESLMNADWSEYNNPDIKGDAIGFRANIPGYFGMVELDGLDPKIPVKIVKAHFGAKDPNGDPINADCILPPSIVDRPETDFTTILIGPAGDKEIVYTFHPGPPLPPATMVWTQELADSVTNVGEAIDAGYKYGKLDGS